MFKEAFTSQPPKKSKDGFLLYPVLIRGKKRWTSIPDKESEMIYAIQDGTVRLANRDDLLSYNDNPKIKCFAIAKHKYEAEALCELYSRELIQPDNFDPAMLHLQCVSQRHRDSRRCLSDQKF